MDERLERPPRHRGRLREYLDRLYARYHHPRWIGTDPLQFVYRYHNDADREVSGLIAASLAYGNVVSIHACVRSVLAIMGDRPTKYLARTKVSGLHDDFRLFRHRWTDGDAMVSLLTGIAAVLEGYGGLGRAFLRVDDGSGDVGLALARWVALMRRPGGRHLLADPGKGSACKRLHLYLRWMIRRDDVDPGCWKGVDPSRLLVPLDTHALAFARAVGFTRSRIVDIRMVREVTWAYRRLCPEDPVRYDFCLTRPGIIDGWRPA